MPETAPGPDRALVLDRIEGGYAGARVLHEVSLRLAPGEVLGLLGRNGAGKTTTLKAIMGLVKPRAGRITLDGRELLPLEPHEIPRLGIAYVPQGRRLFPFFTVEENLEMGLLAAPAGGGGRHPPRGGAGRGAPGVRAETLEWIFEVFPMLKERLQQRAGTLSGGEQQILAVARALCAAPHYLLMDEPGEGLMPTMVQMLLETIRLLKARRVGVLLVEQKIEAALQVADAVVLLEHGHVRHQATPAELARDPGILARYLGVGRSGH